MKVGMLTTWQVKCGIAAYTGDLVKALREQPDVEVEVAPIEAGIQPDAHYRGQADLLNQCDLVHIQHEYSFWGGYVPGKNRFLCQRDLIRKPVVLTGHTTTPLEVLIVPPKPDSGDDAAARLRVAYRRARMKLLLPILFRSRAYRRWVEYSPFASAAQVIVHTDEARDALARRGIPAERIHVLPAGIPGPLASRDGGSAFRKRFRLEGQRLVTLFGYVNQFKGYELMLDLLPQLPDDVAFVIAGGARTETEEPYVAALCRKISESGLQSRAVVTGFLPDEDVADAMAASDVVVVPHTQATGSYSVTVPLGYGKPLLASDLACFKEIASQSGCMRLFPSGDRAALLGGLQSTLANPAQLDGMSEQARRYADEHSWRKVAARTIEVYKKALA